jgi:predicted DNA-binding transcriptional regulator AlpA
LEKNHNRSNKANQKSNTHQKPISSLNLKTRIFCPFNGEKYVYSKKYQLILCYSKTGSWSVAKKLSVRKLASVLFQPTRLMEIHMDTKLPESGFVRLPQILAVFPVSRSAFWAGVKTGRYPKPVKLSPRCTAWRVDDIHALIENTWANR